MLAIVATVTFIGLVFLFGTMARRLLGIRFSRFRAVAAGLLALTIGGPLVSLIVGSSLEQGEGVALLLLVLATACAVLAAMIFLVLAEAFVPSGSVPRVMEWLPALRRRIARTSRYTRLSTIAVRHGLGPYLRGRGDAAPSSVGGRQRLARSLRAALDEGGVTFVKLGQVLSTRQDLLPPEFVEELAGLQDRASAAPWEQVEEVLVAELGRPVQEVFAEFDQEPLAAASIAQVYVARLRTGEEVIVKVQRPGIRTTVERDLDIVTRLGRSLQNGTRWGRSLGVAELTQGFAEALREELDFRIEAGNMAAVGAAARLRADTSVLYPVPHEELSGERVLVMDRLPGRSLRRSGSMIDEAGWDRAELARSLLHCVLRQIMFDGVFHADPHPGNVMVTETGRIGLLDFGSVGRLDGLTKDSLAQLLLGLNTGNASMVADALLAVVERPDDVDEQRLERALGQFMARHLSAGMTPSAQMFVDLFGIVSRHGLAVPPQLAAVARALGTLEGTLQVLLPRFDLVAEARTFGEQALASQGTAGSVRETVKGELLAMLPMLRRLPRRLDRISDSLEQGRLSINVRLFADERDRRFATGLVHQVLLTLLGITSGLIAVMLLGLQGGPQVLGSELSLYAVFGYCLLVIASVLVLRVLVSIFRTDRGRDPASRL
ncbi:putative unusual protein kinase [Actinoalloteichus sp. GBA129-24]|nr:putative unusual protein kinase [Actinoalloteichus sp. GBA129-24]